MSADGKRSDVKDLKFELYYVYEQKREHYLAALAAKQDNIVRYSMVCKHGGVSETVAFVQLQAEVRQSLAHLLRGEECSDDVGRVVEHMVCEAGGAKPPPIRSGV